jgi:hypothetical protein
MTFKKGFIGYENYTDQELEDECVDRDMWDILLVGD